MPGVPVVESLRGCVADRYVAVLVEDPESVAAFKDEGRRLCERVGFSNTSRRVPYSTNSPPLIKRRRGSCVR